IVVYVVDSARATNPTTFMSNMLYACSILYRTKLPFIVAFNKADIVSPAFARSWMRDFERFDQALEENRSSYMNDLSRSLSLVLEEFYTDLKTVSVSSATGEGMDEFMKAVGECVEQYKKEYVPMYTRVLVEKSKLDEQEKQRKMSEVSDKMEVLSVHPTLDPPIRERIHIGGVEQENAEDANVLHLVDCYKLVTWVIKHFIREVDHCLRPGFCIPTPPHAVFVILSPSEFHCTPYSFITSASVLLGRADGAPTVVEAVQFHGIRITKNDALVKEVSELYRSSTLDELVHNSHLAAKHLQEVGLMDSAVPLIDVAPSNNGYIVNFVVKEPKAFSLGLKAGISTNGDADMSLNAGKQSVGGRGEAISSSYTYTVKGDHSFNLSFAKPFLGWQKYSNVSATLFRAISYLPWNHSNCEENAIIFGYNGRITKNILHQIKFNTLWRTLRATDDAAFLVREHAGHTTKFSLENAVGFDTRDRPILASKGILARLTQEYAGPFGDSSFIRHQLDLQAAAPLPFGFILSASAQLKNVKGLGDREIHLLDRVYLGGQQDVRGFGLNTLGARSENSCLGGGTAACGVLHLYRPLFPPQAGVVQCL
ncbi:hypothetical protein GCK32_010574, partial [Trichostrongylus colubriformis]